MIIIPQGIDDEITYKFNVGNLGVNTIVGVTAVSSTLTISNVTNDPTSISFNVDSTGVKGSAVVDIVLTLSNGDVENKCIKFMIGTIYI